MQISNKRLHKMPELHCPPASLLSDNGAVFTARPTAKARCRSKGSGSTNTERAGFEPAMEFNPHTRLAGECLQPLGHLSRDYGKASLETAEGGGVLCMTEPVWGTHHDAELDPLATVYRVAQPLRLWRCLCFLGFEPRITVIEVVLVLFLSSNAFAVSRCLPGLSRRAPYHTM